MSTMAHPPVPPTWIFYVLAFNLLTIMFSVVLTIGKIIGGFQNISWWFAGTCIYLFIIEVITLYIWGKL